MREGSGEGGDQPGSVDRIVTWPRWPHTYGQPADLGTWSLGENSGLFMGRGGGGRALWADRKQEGGTMGR